MYIILQKYSTVWCYYHYYQATDQSIIEEILLMILEIVNSFLSHHLQHNPHLVYSLLYQREVFDPYRSNPSLVDLIRNVCVCMDVCVRACVCVDVCGVGRKRKKGQKRGRKKWVQSWEAFVCFTWAATQCPCKLGLEAQSHQYLSWALCVTYFWLL